MADKPEINMNGRAKLYLQCLVAAIGVVIIISGYVFGTAVIRNDADHLVIMRTAEAHTIRLEAKIDAIATIFNIFAQGAPPDHVHLDDGTTARVSK